MTGARKILKGDPDQKPFADSAYECGLPTSFQGQNLKFELSHRFFVKNVIFSQFHESQSFWNHQKWILREKLEVGALFSVFF